MPILINDKEVFENLLLGKKIEKIRHSGSGKYFYLKDGVLVDQDGNHANLYKINPTDLYQTIEEE